MSKKYYESELSYLRDLGREFSQANPQLGGMLLERSGDPDVERLLEGFAFLSARIRERVDDDSVRAWFGEMIARGTIVPSGKA